MVETRRSQDVAVYNERSLKALDRAIALSLGEFSLVLVRCNYQRLRERMVQQLQELSKHRYKVRDVVLPESATTLYTTIKAYRHCNEDTLTQGHGDTKNVEDAGTQGHGDVGNSEQDTLTQ
ncbi:MAG: hypothetical protein ICV63_19995, partial [Coleofasciculus sp. Co-bin14]|nr:hypothetical protein [Coleofasciculus sp. Co-bin14]